MRGENCWRRTCVEHLNAGTFGCAPLVSYRNMCIYSCNATSLAAVESHALHHWWASHPTTGRFPNHQSPAPIDIQIYWLRCSHPAKLMVNNPICGYGNRVGRESRVAGVKCKDFASSSNFFQAFSRSHEYQVWLEVPGGAGPFDLLCLQIGLSGHCC